MYHEITIVVDTNDGDYITEISKISEEELEKLRPLIQAIKSFEPYKVTIMGSDLTWKHDHNYPFGECYRQDLGEKTPEELYPFGAEIHELFLEYLPMESEYGFHSIKRIEVGPIVEKERLL